MLTKSGHTTVRSNPCSPRAATLRRPGGFLTAPMTTALLLPDKPDITNTAPFMALTISLKTSLYGSPKWRCCCTTPRAEAVRLGLDASVAFQWLYTGLSGHAMMNLISTLPCLYVKPCRVRRQRICHPGPTCVPMRAVYVHRFMAQFWRGVWCALPPVLRGGSSMAGSGDLPGSSLDNLDNCVTIFRWHRVR